MVKEDLWHLWKGGVVGKKSPKLGMVMPLLIPILKSQGTEANSSLWVQGQRGFFLTMFQDSYSETKSKKLKAWDYLPQL